MTTVAANHSFKYRLKGPCRCLRCTAIKEVDFLFDFHLAPIEVDVHCDVCDNDFTVKGRLKAEPIYLDGGKYVDKE